nr:MAG TPA: hypothetical protein [Microviridae sp.]
MYLLLSISRVVSLLWRLKSSVMVVLLASV